VSKSESDVQQLIQIEGPHHGCILMRNNSGSMTNKDGRHVRFGLGNISKKYSDNVKSSDLIGITSVVITPDMVGKTVGIFTAVEVKPEGWVYHNSSRERAQMNFIKWVVKLGGIASFCSSVGEFKDIFKYIK